MASAQPGFDITHGKGFHVTFANGHTVSVQFGGGNYCDNYNLNAGAGRNGSALPHSADAEVAAWGPDGNWHRLGDDDDVIGRQSPSEVLAILNRIAAIPAEGL